MQTEEGLFCGSSFDVTKDPQPIGLKVEPASMHSELFPAKGPIRAQVHGLFNFDKKQVKKQREQRILAE